MNDMPGQLGDHADLDGCSCMVSLLDGQLAFAQYAALDRQ